MNQRTNSIQKPMIDRANRTVRQEKLTPRTYKVATAFLGEDLKKKNTLLQEEMCYVAFL